MRKMKTLFDIPAPVEPQGDATARPEIRITRKGSLSLGSDPYFLLEIVIHLS